MKLAISDIAWDKTKDEMMYQIIHDMGYESLEIAPTRIFPENPYDKINEAIQWSGDLKEKYDISVCSMQSIWYGRNEMIFGNQKERRFLVEYTKKAVDFAEAIGAKNLVFGCPRNRVINTRNDVNIAIDFFSQISEYAFEHGTVISLEANPPIYNTNFINTTVEAITFIKNINHPGLRLNLDMGTMIYNNESVDIIMDDMNLVSHIHISEPNLKPIIYNEMCKTIINKAKANHYDGYISIEMGSGNSILDIEKIMITLKTIYSGITI